MRNRKVSILYSLTQNSKCEIPTKGQFHLVWKYIYVCSYVVVSTTMTGIDVYYTTTTVVPRTRYVSFWLVVFPIQDANITLIFELFWSKVHGCKMKYSWSNKGSTTPTGFVFLWSSSQYGKPLTLTNVCLVKQFHFWKLSYHKKKTKCFNTQTCWKLCTN